MERKFIQIGVVAARDPDGNFLPAVPIYVEATPELEAAETEVIADIGKIFAQKMKQYIDEGGLDAIRKPLDAERST